MKLTRKISFQEWNTLEKIKKDIQRFVAKSLTKKGRPVDPINQVTVNTTQTIEQLLFKTKNKL
jgi:hypothetical protein